MTPPGEHTASESRIHYIYDDTEDFMNQCFIAIFRINQQREILFRKFKPISERNKP